MGGYRLINYLLFIVCILELATTLADTFGDDTGTGTHSRDFAIHAFESAQFHLAERFEFFSVDHRAVTGQGHRASGVAGATTAGYDLTPTRCRPRPRRRLLLRCRG